jgi:hypothetical protein
MAYLVSIGPATWLNYRRLCRTPPGKRSVLPITSEIREGEYCLLMAWMAPKLYDLVIPS